jgi:hypothetical protein
VGQLDEKLGLWKQLEGRKLPLRRQHLFTTPQTPPACTTQTATRPSTSYTHTHTHTQIHIMADALKAEGNKLFTEKKFAEAM